VTVPVGFVCHLLNLHVPGAKLFSSVSIVPVTRQNIMDQASVFRDKRLVDCASRLY
jgi:hypothetical protein